MPFNGEGQRLVGSVAPSVPLWAVFTDEGKVCTAEILLLNIYEVRYEAQDPAGDAEERVTTEIVPVAFDSLELCEIEGVDNFIGISLEKDPDPAAWAGEIRKHEARQR